MVDVDVVAADHHAVAQSSVLRAAWRQFQPFLVLAMVHIVTSMRRVFNRCRIAFGFPAVWLVPDHLLVGSPICVLPLLAQFARPLPPPPPPPRQVMAAAGLASLLGHAPNYPSPAAAAASERFARRLAYGATAGVFGLLVLQVPRARAIAAAQARTKAIMTRARARHTRAVTLYPRVAFAWRVPRLLRARCPFSKALLACFFCVCVPAAEVLSQVPGARGGPP